jgi:hypothetical protein
VKKARILESEDEHGQVTDLDLAAISFLVFLAWVVGGFFAAVLAGI